MHRDLIEHGLLIAAGGLAAHQLTGSPIPDAIGSILIGLMLGVVAIVLINRNRRFLIGEQADSRVRAATLQAVLAMPEVARVTYLPAPGDRRAADGYRDR